ncbi:MAG: hypothetical protein ACTSUE_04245 [Promethearchaeota archaeon]
MSEELKTFNKIIQEEIQKAHLFEKNKLWKRAKNSWLDIIEYCILFAKKTPNLKDDVASMILNKANKLMDRVKKIENEIADEEMTPPRAVEHVEDVHEPPRVESPVQSSEDESEYPGTPVSDQGSSIFSPTIPQFRDDGTAEMKRPVDAKGGRGEESFIKVGDVKIDIPDDFPLVEITPKDSFKPPEESSSKVEVDTTREYIENDDTKDPSSNQE